MTERKRIDAVERDAPKHARRTAARLLGQLKNQLRTADRRRRLHRRVYAAQRFHSLLQRHRHRRADRGDRRRRFGRNALFCFLGAARPGNDDYV